MKTDDDIKHMLGLENGLDKMHAKYEKATGKKITLTLDSMEEFVEWLKVNEPEFYNGYKKA